MSQGQEVFLFQPTQVSGCQLWLDAADVNGNGTALANGASVSTWVDKSGFGNNGTQSTSANRPTFNNNVVSFTGSSSNYISLPSGAVWPSANSSLSIQMVITPKTNSGVNVFLFQGTISPAACIGLYTTGTAYSDYWQGNHATSWGSMTIGKTDILGYIYSQNTNILGFIDGTQYTVSASQNAYSAALSPASLGAEVGRSFYSTVDIREVLIYNRNLSVAERQQIEGYLAWKWGLQGNLPSNHPYKSYRPLAQTPFPTQIPPMPIITQNVAAFVPLQISGCQLWLDATDPAATGIPPASGAAVTQWRDKSTNRLTGTAVNSPTYQANIQNGLPVIRFNGTNQYINFGNVLNLGTNGITVFMVTKYAINAGNQVGMVGKASYRGNPGRWAFVYDTVAGGPNGVGVDFFIEDTNQSLTGIVFNPATRFNIFTAVNNRTSFNRIYANGTFGSQQTFTATANNLSNTDPLYVAAYPNNTGSAPQAGQFMNGDIAEIIVYFSALSDTQRQQVEGYLAWKWGLLSNLPNGHPYKAQPIVPFPARSVAFNGNASSWLPTRTTGCQLWFDATDPLTVGRNGTSVTSWTSKGTNSLVISQSSSNPVYTFNVYNSLPTLRFSFGNTLPLSNASVSSSIVQTSLSYSIFLVHTPNANNSTPFAFLTGGGSRLSVVTPESSNISYDGISARLSYSYPSQAAYLNGALRMEAFYSLSSTGFYRRDGSQLATASLGSGTYNSTQNFFIGGAVPNYPGYYYGGDICEVVWFNLGLTTAQIQQVEGYLAWKWGLQGNLPANHPYKLWPPPP